MKTETATKNKKERMDRILALMGIRMIGRDMAEVPEKIPVPESKEEQKE